MYLALYLVQLLLFVNLLTTSILLASDKSCGEKITKSSLPSQNYQTM